MLTYRIRRCEFDMKFNMRFWLEGKGGKGNAATPYTMPMTAYANAGYRNYGIRPLLA